MINRRSLITGLISFVAAPAIVRATSLMQIRSTRVPMWDWDVETIQKWMIDDMTRRIAIEIDELHFHGGGILVPQGLLSIAENFLSDPQEVLVCPQQVNDMRKK